LRNLFDQDYEVQTMHISLTTVVQARKSSTLRDLTGLSAALTIKITPEAGGTRVEIGMQKWLDKAAVAAVALLLSATADGPAALGAYWQYKSPRCLEDNRRTLARKRGYVPPLPGRCGNCGAAIRPAPISVRVRGKFQDTLVRLRRRSKDLQRDSVINATAPRGGFVQPFLHPISTRVPPASGVIFIVNAAERPVRSRNVLDFRACTTVVKDMCIVCTS